MVISEQISDPGPSQITLHRAFSGQNMVTDSAAYCPWLIMVHSWFFGQTNSFPAHGLSAVHSMVHGSEARHCWVAERAMYSKGKEIHSQGIVESENQKKGQ